MAVDSHFPQWPLVAVLGPTGAGKSELALFLAEAFEGEILNCDSIQVYRGLDVGSAKLPLAARRSIPHHLIDIASVDCELTAGEYARRARQVLAEIRGRQRLPIVAGGTGFYLRALLDGLSPAPRRDEPLRTRLRALAERRPGVLHRFLRIHDPTAALRIHPNDRQKLIRAIELTLLAGQPATGVQSVARDRLQGFAVLKLGLAPDRALLRERLNTRSAALFRSGLLEETQTLLEAGFSPEAKPLQALGYKQALQILSGQVTLEQAIRECQTKTRQYAKRQMTWFRHEPDVVWLSGFGWNPVVQQQALDRVRALLARP
ncbi:MAG TPA: tRNA (adenosine(37)-N6)-dimethylallyltransferase MiaA [Bryobacteraceae bacterium]|nr:tRNA (adenosine(37)-N6)-dimethylallyltransferase MiaA [Bryobacteraceae bacterium]